MKTSPRLFVLAFLAASTVVLAALDGCTIDDKCIRQTDCASGLNCVGGSCVAPIPTSTDAGDADGEIGAHV